MPTRTPAQQSSPSSATSAIMTRLTNSFRLSLQAANKVPETIKGYLDAVGLVRKPLSMSL